MLDLSKNALPLLGYNLSILNISKFISILHTIAETKFQYHFTDFSNKLKERDNVIKEIIWCVAISFFLYHHFLWYSKHFRLSFTIILIYLKTGPLNASNLPLPMQFNHDAGPIL